MKYDKLIKKLKQDLEDGCFSVKQLDRDLTQYLKEKSKANIHIDADRLIEKMSEMTGVSIELFKSKSRKREVVLGRNVMFYHLSRFGYPSTNIGYYFDKNHASILHGINTISSDIRLYEEDLEFFNNFNDKIKELCF